MLPFPSGQYAPTLAVRANSCASDRASRVRRHLLLVKHAHRSPLSVWSCAMPLEQAIHTTHRANGFISPLHGHCTQTRAGTASQRQVEVRRPSVTHTVTMRRSVMRRASVEGWPPMLNQVLVTGNPTFAPLSESQP